MAKTFISSEGASVSILSRLLLRLRFMTNAFFWHADTTMKLSAIASLALLSSAAAFTPATQGPQTSALNAEMMNRKAFIAAAGASIFAAAPLIANAGTMGQERVNDPTEV